MSDLISRADAINAVRSYFKDRLGKSKCDYDEELQLYVLGKEERTMLTYNKGINDKLRSLPSADVVQGGWVIEDAHTEHCSVCGYAFHTSALFAVGGNDEPNFCPHCGARMKGGDNE